MGFDPEDTLAEPLCIREQAQGFARIGGQLTGRLDSLDFVLHSLAGSFSEVLHPLLAARIGEQVYTVQEVVAAMIYAEQVTVAWAEDVGTFKRRRAELVEHWECAQANGFWITRVPGYDNVEPEMAESLYDHARQRVLDELNADATVAFAAFTAAAQDRGRLYREGPTLDNVVGLRSAGLLDGAAIPVLFAFFPVTGPRSGLPREYWGRTSEQIVEETENDPELAALLVARRPDLLSADPYEAALAQAVMMLRGDESGAAYGDASGVRAALAGGILAGIPPAELALLAAVFPSVVGNLNGMPFEHRISANRVRVADALHRARAERPHVAAEAADAADRLPETPGYESGAREDDIAAQQRLADLDVRIEQYERLLTESTIDYGNQEGPPWPDYRGRKVVYFDPSGDGSWAELVGTINADTDSVGIFVPGVGTDAPDMSKKSDDATAFVEQAARDGEQLAMIVWAGGDFPDVFPAALNGGYAEDLVEPLVDFSYAVEQEIGLQAPGREVPVTVIGHSYGGMAVSKATLSGLSADRLLFVNSAGLGSGDVGQLDEYEAYAMDAPGDWTPMLGPLIHETAPIDLAGVVVLETGVYADGSPIEGIAGHSGVFKQGSTSWDNILAVLTGRPVLTD